LHRRKLIGESLFSPKTRTAGSDQKEIVMSATRPSLAPRRRLPEQPSLEQLRKQAKDLLRNYRSGIDSAVAEVSQFEHSPTRATFGLSDAQRVIARAYGFASWPKLKAFVDGATIARFISAVKAGDLDQVRSMLASRPELIAMDAAENDEHRGLHYAVLGRDLALVRLLMEAGADARKGIFPHRDATSALALAREREFSDVVAVIEEEERQRREEMSCPNATVSPIQDQISAAISRGDDQTARQLLEADRPLIQACDRDGLTPLHVAARVNSIALMEWLLAKRASVRKKDPNGLTPLDHAALGADPRNDRAVRFPRAALILLQHGSELTLRAAVAMGECLRVRQLIAAEPGLLREIKDPGLLTLAVKHRQLEVAHLLLDLGADVDERILLESLEEPTESWGMPLWNAALAGDLAMTRLLLDRGADPNANVYASGWPLRNAWGHDDDSVKRLLLERGAKPKPYMVAEMHNIAEAKRLLADAPSEELVRELAWSAADHGCPEIVELALTQLDPSAQDSRWWHWLIIQPIRGAGADSLENNGHFRSMEIILRHGVDPNVSRFSQTALHFAAAYHGAVSGEDRARFAAMLIDHGASMNVRDDLLQSTPLGWACRWGRRELVELLIRRGAPVGEKDAEAWATPEAWARKMNHPEILEILEGQSEAR
jgi:ankyrin repeat protein